MSVLSSELREWLKPGYAGMLAAVAGDDGPETTRIWAARFVDARDELELYVHRSGSARVLELLANGGRAAANLVDVRSYRSRLFKGRCRVPRVEVDEAFLEEWLGEMQSAFAAVGMPPDCVDRILSHYDEPRAMLPLVLEIESAFDQSPKPGAGARL
jgi:hypothetical protein